MKLSQYLQPEYVFIRDDIAETSAFYHEFSRFLEERGVVEDGNCIKRLFLKRESIQSTGIGKGAATPHIYSDQFPRFSIFIALSRNGIDFHSPEGGPVHLIFVIVSDERDVGLHLKSLQRISRLVLHTEVVELAKKAGSEEELLQIILNAEKEI